MRKRILFVIESLSGGGAEKVLSTILKHLDPSRFDVTLCSICDVGVYKKDIPAFVSYCSLLPDASHLSRFALLVYKLKYHLIYYWLPARWIYSLFIPKGAELEIAFTEGFITKLLSHSTSSTSKRIAWVHIDLDAFPWTLTQGLFKSLEDEASCYKRFNQIVAVSESVKQSFERKIGQLVPLTVLYNPVDSDEIRCKAQAICPVSWPKDRSICRLVGVGRLTEQKGFDRLIKICGRLHREGVRFFLNIIGEGAQRGILEKIIVDDSLEQQVKLPGFIPNPYPAIAEADLLVCPSRAEGYSTVITESLILGIPLISTDCAGVREQLGVSGCGIVTQNDDDFFYHQLRILLDDRTKINALKEKAKERGGDFCLSSTMATLEQFLLSC